MEAGANRGKAQSMMNSYEIKERMQRYAKDYKGSKSGTFRHLGHLCVPICLLVATLCEQIQCMCIMYLSILVHWLPVLLIAVLFATGWPHCRSFLSNGICKMISHGAGRNGADG